MANPNLNNVATVYGNTGLLTVSTVTTNVVANPSASATLYRLTMLSVANINTAASAVTVELNRGGANTTIVKGLPVAANSMSVVLGKDTNIYLLENDAVQLTASANGYLHATAVWEQMS